MYVYICLVDRINQTCFQKFKSSNVFYARAWQKMPVAKEELGVKRLVHVYSKRLISNKTA